ncbi:MAG: zinc-dependent metalloprotease family protein [Verrucomicrobiota bacterium]
MFWRRVTAFQFSVPRRAWLCHQWLAVLLAGCTWLTSTAPAFAQAPRPALPELRVRGGVRGEEAIQALGNRLPEVAAHYRKTEDELRGMLHRDKSLRLDVQGRLNYACEGMIAPVVSGAGEETILPAALAPLTDTFLLHSKPDSNRKIYLDFDGHTLITNAWTASYNGGTNIVAPPWNIEGSDSDFSDAERTLIQRVWLRVAEDFASFDVDVTTEYPGEAALTRANAGDQVYGIRALVSAISSYFGNYGGIAYVGVFDNTGDYNKPALIFPEKLSNNEKNIAEAISHEVGHTLGLSHDGISGGTEYYAGQNNWAPIMGVGYSKPIVQWSRGEYANANNTQNDLNVIQANGLSYRADDVGSTIATATVLNGLNVTNVGILERTNDVDFFSVQSLGGAATFTVTPWERGANVHFQLAVYDSAGTLLTNRQVADTTSGVMPVAINCTLAAGTFYVSVEGVGSGDPVTTGYSDYGSLGNYTFTASLPAPISVAASPTNLALIVVTNRLQLSWPADHIGWRLEAQTNAVGSGFGTNWYNVTGATATNRVFIPISAAPGSVFFRLAYP